MRRDRHHAARAPIRSLFNALSPQESIFEGSSIAIAASIPSWHASATVRLMNTHRDVAHVDCATNPDPNGEKANTTVGGIHGRRVAHPNQLLWGSECGIKQRDYYRLGVAAQPSTPHPLTTSSCFQCEPQFYDVGQLSQISPAPCIVVTVQPGSRLPKQGQQ